MAELQEFSAGQKDLAELVSEAKSRERVTRRKALLYTILPIVIGVIFLALSLVKVSRLEKTATDLNGQIASKKDELNKLEARRKELEESLKVTTTTLVDIKDNPQDASEKARKALKIVSDKVATISSVQSSPNPGAAVRSPTPETSSDKSGAGPWVVAVISHKDLGSARESASSAQQLGLGQILICQKQNWWRVMAVFSSKAAANSSLQKIRARFKGDSAVRDMNKWCINRVEVEAGLCKCPG